MDLTPAEILNGLRQKNQLLTAKNEEYQQLVKEKAEAERAYSVALAQKMLELKTNGQSVTLIKDLAKGDPTVAKLKLTWDVQDGVTRACLKSIGAITNQIDSYRSILSWLKAEYRRTE